MGTCSHSGTQYSILQLQGLVNITNHVHVMSFVQVRGWFRCIWFNSMCDSLKPTSNSWIYRVSVVHRKCWHLALGVRNPYSLVHLTLSNSLDWISIRDIPINCWSYPSWAISRPTSNCPLLCIMQHLVSWFPLFYCTESYINCLHTVSHIRWRSMFISAIRTYPQPCEESLFREESRYTPWVSTCTHIEENSPSLLSIECLWLEPSAFVHCIADD